MWVPYASVICVMADMVDEVLLGEDHLLCDSSDPADIIQSGQKCLRGATLPLKMVRPCVVRHVTTAESIKVFSMEEVIVDAYVDSTRIKKGRRRAGCW